MTRKDLRSRLSRRSFLRTSAAAGSLALAGARGEPQRQRDPGEVQRAVPQENNARTIVLLLTDDHGAHLGCLGTHGLATPHIDGLAEDGLLFPYAYASCASCSPSRASILTGMYPHSNGLWRNVRAPTLNDPPEAFARGNAKFDRVGVHEDIPTLVELLQQAGYHTGITQKFHVTPPWKFAFDSRKPCPGRPDRYAEAVEAIVQEAGERPLFVMANIGNTHRPFRPTVEGLDLPRVDPALVEVPANLPDVADVRTEVAEYLDTVRVADACVGATLDELKEAGRFDDALLIMTGDQGYGFQRAKASIYEAGIRVPFVVRPPGGGTGRVLPDTVSLLDIMPTICDYAGLDTPDTAQGLNLRPLIEGRADALGRETVFAEHNAHGPGEPSLYPSRSVRAGRWKYIRNLLPDKRYVLPADLEQAETWGNRTYPATVAARDEFPVQYQHLQATHHRPPEEFYDLHTDPWEMENRVADERFAEPLERLRGVLDDWMRETGDTGKPEEIVRRTG